MADEVVKILRVETQGSERTVKGLKDEIKSLRDAILNVEQGSEEYDSIVKQLRKDQEDLSNAMSAGKAEIEGLEGSYNYLVRTMKDLKTEWRSTTNAVRREQLGQEIDNINNQLKELDASIGNYQRNVGNYAEGFSEAMREQQQATEITRAKFESVSKIATGLASGYAALQGVTALLGVENEKLQETFVKLQAAIALAQGIGGIKDLVEGIGMAKVAFKSAIVGVKSFIVSLRGVKAAIAGTGIGLLVVAIGSLVEYLMTMEDEADNATDALEDFNNELARTDRFLKMETMRLSNSAMKEYIKAVQEAGNDVNKLVAAEKALNKAMKENALQMAEKTYQEASKNYKEANKAFTDYINNVKHSVIPSVAEKYSEEEKRLQQAADEAQVREKEALEKLNQIRVEQAKEGADAIIEQQKKVLENQKENEKEQEEIIERLGSLNKSARQKELDELLKQYNEEKEILKGRNDDLLLLNQEYNQKVSEINEKYRQKELQKMKEDEEKLKNELSSNLSSSESEQSYREQETEIKYDVETSNPIDAINLEIEKLNELRNIRLEYHNERLEQIQELYDKETTSIETKQELEKEKQNLIRENALEEKKYANEIVKLKGKKSKEEKKIDEITSKTSLDIAKSTFSSLSKIAGEESKAGKALAIAGATIDTYQAANSAYKAMAGIPVVGPALGAAAAAAAVLAGMANVKQIMSVDESGSSSSVPTSSGIGVTPSFNMSESLPVQYSRNLLTDSETEELNAPTRVYVLESDITEVQNKVKVSETNSSF